MTWHYAAGGVQHGPVDDAELDRLLASGAITPETPVWRAGMPEWVALREARAGAILSEALVQARSSRSATSAPQPRIDPESADARIVAEGRRVRVLDSLRRGWNLVFARPGESIGVSALVILTMFGAGMVPCVGAIGQIVATGPLVGSWYLYFLKRVRGQPTEWADAWAGFSSPMLVQLVLQYIVATAAVLAVMTPFIAAFFVALVGVIAAAAGEGRLMPPAVIGMVGLFLVTLCAGTYLHIVWMFAPALVIDKQLGFWPAMKLSWRVAHRQFLPLLGLYLLCGLVYLAGFLALCVGLIVALPVCLAAMAYAYEDLFGERPPA
jgi:hypothetical protein